MLLLPGRVPTSSSTHTFGCSSEPNALKNQRCELIFFWFFSLRQKITWTGTRPFSAPSILLDGVTETRARSQFSWCAMNVD